MGRSVTFIRDQFSCYNYRMKKCEKCRALHEGTYGSGRFCGVSCSRSNKMPLCRGSWKEAVTVGRIKATLVSMEKAAGELAEKITVYFRNPKYCTNCNSMLPYSKRVYSFCNRSCSGKYNNALKIKYYTCLACGITTRNKKFCSSKCSAVHRYSLLSFTDLKKDSSRRTFLIRRDGHHCTVCLNSHWMNSPIPLELDHKDGNPENNKEENCRVICPNCHAQTPTYKGRNMGKVTNSKRQNTMALYNGKYR